MNQCSIHNLRLNERTKRLVAMLPVAALVYAIALPSTIAAQVPWSFSFETNQRLVADALRGESIVLAGQGNTSEWDAAHTDFNLDGRHDVIAVRKDSDDNVINPTLAGYVLLNVNGKLTDVTRTKARDLLNNPASSRDVEVCDANGDGFPDCFISNTFNENPQLLINLRNDSNGNWRGLRLATNWFTTAQGNNSFLADTPSGISSCAGACADVDGDGDQDFLITAYSWTSPSGFTTPPEDRLLINDGTGHFQEESNRLAIPSVDRFHTNIQFFDVDNDGDQDYLTSAVLDNMVVAINNGQGFFTTENEFGLGGITYSGWVLEGVTNSLDGIYSGNDDQDRTAVFLPAGNVSSSQVTLSRDTLDMTGNVRPFFRDTNTTTITGVGVGTSGAFNQSSLNFTIHENQFVNLSSPYLVDPDPTTKQNYQLKGVWDFVFLLVDDDNKYDMVIFHRDGVDVLIQD